MGRMQSGNKRTLKMGILGAAPIRALVFSGSSAVCLFILSSLLSKTPSVGHFQSPQDPIRCSPDGNSSLPLPGSPLEPSTGYKTRTQSGNVKSRLRIITPLGTPGPLEPTKRTNNGAREGRTGYRLAKKRGAGGEMGERYQDQEKPHAGGKR